MARGTTPLMSKARFHLKLWAILVTIAFIAGIAIGATLFSPDELSHRKVELPEKTLRNDWANLARYAPANASLTPPAEGTPRVVFFGDSITDFWIQEAPDFFRNKAYIDRGIGGQTTPQLLVRFRQDVVALHPAVVVILGGINDLSGLTGPSTPEMIEGNLQSMIEIAVANGIKPILASLLPNDKHTVDVALINRWMEDYAQKHGYVFLNYHPALADDTSGFRKELTWDGLHPNPAGYAIMGPLAEKAIAQALGREDAAKETSPAP